MVEEFLSSHQFAKDVFPGEDVLALSRTQPEDMLLMLKKVKGVLDPIGQQGDGSKSKISEALPSILSHSV